MTSENKLIIIMAIIFVDIIQVNSLIMVLLNIFAISYVYKIFDSNGYSSDDDLFRSNADMVKNYIEVYITGKTVPENVTVIETDKDVIVKVDGDASRIKTTSSDIIVSGDAIRVETVSGDVSTKNIGGDVSTVSGDVTATEIHGSVKTVSGDIITEEEE